MKSINVLETFKKHIGDFDLQETMEVPLEKELRVRDFGDDIKSVNNLIGALQTLQFRFKKIYSLLEVESSNEQIKCLVNDCSFLGTDLFDTTLSAKIGEKIIKVENPSPLHLLENTEGFKEYIQNKQDEITLTLNELIAAANNESLFKKESNVDFEHFNKEAFLKAF